MSGQQLGKQAPEVVSCRRLALMAVCCLGMVWASAQADVITMSDGRVMEGKIVSEKGDTIHLEIAMSGIRATRVLKRKDIKSIQEKPLPKDDFDESTPKETSLSGKKLEKHTGLYLEVPIIGRLGDQVFSNGIRNALYYAKERGIGDIVFIVDSTGGATDEAIAVHKALAQYASGLTYHAIIRQCLGVALVVPFWCETMHVTPGATIGGSNEKLEKVPSKFASKGERVIRAQIARVLSEEARKRGRTGEYIKAMMDPEESLAGWRDANGKVHTGPKPPADLPADHLIFKCDRGTVLVLSCEKAVQMGVPSIEGGAEQLGKALGLSQWKSAGSYGQEAMTRALNMHRQQAANAQAKNQQEVTSNVNMREATAEDIQYNLKEASKWDPTKATYKTFSGYWDSNWGTYVPIDEGIWTPESQAKWRDRNEACGYFMERALVAIDSMIDLENRARELELVPTFKDRQLEKMRDDVATKLEMLQRTRYRTGE